jgi:ribonucleoside-diphosphate reductase alpha chain
VFKTAFELDQRWLIEHAADRTPYICQAQSLNIFVPADVHKRDLHQIHWMAWKRGVKSLYYCRSKSIQRAENGNGGDGKLKKTKLSSEGGNKYEECLACQ